MAQVLGTFGVNGYGPISPLKPRGLGPAVALAVEPVMAKAPRRKATRSLRCLAGLIASLVLIAGCDPQKVSELEEGVSTEQDVRTRFGAPETIWNEPNGDRTFEYPRQPAGNTNYMISIGPDGRLTSLRQVLHPNYFAKVTPGLTKDEVRRMLGKPAKMQAYRLKGEEVWDWRYADGTTGVKIFSVTFDSAGAVRGTAAGLDPKDQQG